MEPKEDPESLSHILDHLVHILSKCPSAISKLTLRIQKNITGERILFSKLPREWNWKKIDILLGPLRDLKDVSIRLSEDSTAISLVKEQLPLLNARHILNVSGE